MEKPIPHRVYSKQFATQVVSDLLDEHLRAYKELQKIVPGLKAKLILIFMHDQTRWNQWKYFIKRVDLHKQNPDLIQDMWLELQEKAKYIAPLVRVFGGAEVMETGHLMDVKYEVTNKVKYEREFEGNLLQIKSNNIKL